jgi:hypothetical protein
VRRQNAQQFANTLFQNKVIIIHEKVPKVQSEAGNRRTDSTMVKENYKATSNDFEDTQHRKLNIEQHESHSKPGLYSDASEW